MKALVLSGGGARGAYQVGVLKALAEIAIELNIKKPFSIYTGISAGAINAAFLAQGADDFPARVEKLVKLWSGIRSDEIFRSDVMSLGKIGFQWMGELSLGGWMGSTHGKSLLDTSPLYHLIERNIDFGRLQGLVDQGELVALALTALNYQTSVTTTFVHGDPKLPDWSRARRRSHKSFIRAEHVMGSSAIPLLFPAVAINGSFYGDGCVRNVAPMSPAIHLHADNLFVIGVRRTTLTADDRRAQHSVHPPSVARVANVLMNAVLLDGIETDMERLARVNGFMQQIPENMQGSLTFKKIANTWIHPSDDIGLLASSMSSRLPRLIRYLLKGLGPLDDASEIISYLLFEAEFCQKLIAMGYRDASRQETEIRRFLS
ncbi:MAG: patatin family protein [Bdellovibrio sp.]|nr:MAG: patatin family protein [Bdellovibrio sp.]